MPLLADYLEEGLDRLGYSVEDAEDEFSRRSAPAFSPKPSQHVAGMSRGIWHGIEHVSRSSPDRSDERESFQIVLAAGCEAG